MVLALYTLALVALVGLFFLLKRLNKEKADYYVIAKEGALETANRVALEYVPISKQFIQTEKGEIVDTSQYQMFLVKGNCMNPRHVYDEDRILVEKVLPENVQSLKEGVLQHGDIILIRLPKEGVYEVREFEQWEEEKMRVSYYIHDKRVVSETLYEPSQVKGIVRRKVVEKKQYSNRNNN